jgi:hypothetical protein
MMKKVTKEAGDKDKTERIEGEGEAMNEKHCEWDGGD